MYYHGLHEVAQTTSAVTGLEPPAGDIDVSICMVSLNCWPVLAPCLESLRATDPAVRHEIIVVDNASTDETRERLAREYPEVVLIRNSRNVGFTKATNQALSVSRGRFVLWLNTDTLVSPTALRDLVGFLGAHPRAGIVGPKVLNADGSFQPQCRRGMPTPITALAYFLGLHKLLPTNRLAGGYLLTYLPVDQSTQVAAVSGCCLLARREVLADIGPLDERIFGFGEDLDWCVRATKAGWEVWYHPGAVIVHLKGQGGAHAKPYHKAWGIHQAMWVFYRAHLRRRYAPFVTALVAIAVSVSLALSLARIWITRRLAGAVAALRSLATAIRR